MVSLSPLADIERNFFWCPVCHEPFQDPKLLPCLHRYCRHCLNGVITADAKNSFNCPLCQQEHTKPKEGVDGFKSDFHIKNVVEFLKLQASFKKDDVKECHGCKKVKKVIAYCFKCKNFLCEQCYDSHLNNDMVIEHRPHTLNLGDDVHKSLTLEKLASLTEDPRCTTHVEHQAQLCCETCGYLPICAACTYGGHKSHNIHDVKVFAPAEREKLGTILTELNKYKDKLYELPKRVENARLQLKANVKSKIEKAESEHKREFEKIAKKAEENRNKLEESKREIKMRKDKDCKQVTEEYLREVEKMKQQYNTILRVKMAKYDKETEQIEDKFGKVDDKLSVKINKLNKELKDFKEKVEGNQGQNEQEIQGIADHAEHTINRYDNLTATSSAVLASKDEWTDARCLPNITVASELLFRDVKKEFKELDSLSDIKISDLSLTIVDGVSIREYDRSVIDIKGIKGMSVRGITCTNEGHIIISGYTSDKYSHITVINKKGETIRNDRIQRAVGPGCDDWRYCESLSQSLIATASYNNQVGIYDISKGSYAKKDIKNIDIGWSGFVTCVASDTRNNIYVGGSGRDVLVFDNELKYQRTLKLPQMINYPWDMTVHEGHLLICDDSGGMAYAVTMEGQEAKLVYQFTKPDLGGRNWRPISVCIDSNHYIHMLWAASGRILTQYSQDGSQLFTTRRVDDDARYLTSLVRDEEDKLLIVTCTTGKLYTFSLDVH